MKNILLVTLNPVKSIMITFTRSCLVLCCFSCVDTVSFKLIGISAEHKNRILLLLIVKGDPDSFKSALTRVFAKTREILECLINLD